MKNTTKMTFATLLLAGVAVVASTGVATARGPGGPGGFGAAADFATLDADGNGALTMEEMLAQGEARFAAADLDGSGALDKAEMVQMVTTGFEDRMAHAQGNHAGRPAPSAERLDWMVQGMFMRMDADDDGVLTPSEMRPPENRLARMFKRFDSDENGAISQTEFDAAIARRGDHTKP